MSNPGAEQHYQGDAGRDYHAVKRGIPPEAYLWVARHRTQKLTPHIRETDVVFEYGVGSGWNLAALKCARRIGFDVSDFLAPTVREHGIEFITNSGEVKDGSVDVAICHHTLEHVESPLAVLRELRRMLRTDGTLLLFVPYENESRYLAHDPAEPNHHLYSWNAQTLGNLVDEAGFTLSKVTVERFRFDRFAANLAVRLRLGETGFRWLRWVGNLIDPEWEVRIVARRRD